MVPPTIAPVRSDPESEGAAVELDVGDVVEVGREDEREDERVRLVDSWNVRLTVGTIRCAVTPLALACTVAATELAVPQPYWK